MDSAKLLATALVSSHLDYYNSLLYVNVDTDLTRLHNRLARLVIKFPPFSRSVPLLCSLHWLPVRFRTLFKINLLTYKTLHENQPVYLRSMLAPSISFTVIKQGNESVSPSGQNQHRCKSFSLLCSISLEQPPTICPLSHFRRYL